MTLVIYLLLYYTHVTCVVLSGSFFFVRGVWMLQERSILQTRLVKIAPHVIDSTLLAAAIGLVIVTGQYPFSMDWLTAKVVALLLYIGFGVMTLRGKTRIIRIIFFGLALLTFAYMVSVAMTRHPAGFFLFIT